jgi:hypothetical protein
LRSRWFEIAAEDRLVELLELVPGVGAKLVGESLPDRGVPVPQGLRRQPFPAAVLEGHTGPVLVGLEAHLDLGERLVGQVAVAVADQQPPLRLPGQHAADLVPLTFAPQLVPPPAGLRVDHDPDRAGRGS